MASRGQVRSPRFASVKLGSLTALLLLAACQQSPPAPAPIATPGPATVVVAIPAPPPTAPTVADQWLGKWTGPEGTFLEVSRAGNGYTILIQSLDGPATYEGAAVGNELRFQRNLKVESLRATKGSETGMKWLQDKQDCLTIKPGEAFCRG